MVVENWMVKKRMEEDGRGQVGCRRWQVRKVGGEGKKQGRRWESVKTESEADANAKCKWIWIPAQQLHPQGPTNQSSPASPAARTVFFSGLFSFFCFSVSFSFLLFFFTQDHLLKSPPGSVLSTTLAFPPCVSRIKCRF